MYNYLHSNMVRFIIKSKRCGYYERRAFTFQYGQIYYNGEPQLEYEGALIYIPIWLDLLCL